MRKVRELNDGKVFCMNSDPNYDASNTRTYSYPHFEVMVDKTRFAIHRHLSSDTYPDGVCLSRKDARLMIRMLQQLLKVKIK